MYSLDNRTDRERYLESELSEAREREDRRNREDEQARKERMQEYRERAESYNRSAETWPEALRKQAYLMQREANDWPEDDNDDLFAPGAAACSRALMIWSEVATEKQSAISELLNQIKAIKDGIKNEVADRLEKEGDTLGWKQVVSALREYDEDDLDSWLDW